MLPVNAGSIMIKLQGIKNRRKNRRMSMDFRELTYVTAVADCKSVTAAAKKLYISQPSLSYILSKVEQDVGVRLFDRKTNPITLTYAGEKYVETARKILKMRDNLRSELLDIGSGEQGEIKIGIPTERAGYMLPKVAGRFQESFPRTEIRLMESKSDEIIESLLNDRITFAILPGGREGLPAGLHTELIYQEQILLVAGDHMIKEDMLVPKDEDGAFMGRDLPVVKLSCTGDLPYIMMQKGRYIRKATDRLFQQANINPKEVMELASCMSAAQLAKSGLGITIVPERAVEALGGREKFHCYYFDERPEFWDVNAVYKEGTYLDRADRYFIDLMKDTFTQHV
jgi:DNA-binding transcriptional LysR family regulator